jgi:hypothetical protein
MTQDIGPEEEVAEEAEAEIAEDADEPVDGRKPVDWRTAVRAVIVVVVVVLILLLCRCGSGGLLGDSGRLKPSISGVQSPPIVSDESTVPNQPYEDGPFVPDVIGMTREAAISAIEAAGYTASATDVYGTTHPANTVFQQHPSGGSRLDPGGRVGMLVQQRGKRMVTVPNLYGLKQADAEQRIRALGLTVVLSYAPETSVRHAGRTYSQWPLPGKQVPFDGEIQIQITVNP